MRTNILKCKKSIENTHKTIADKNRKRRDNLEEYQTFKYILEF